MRHSYVFNFHLGRVMQKSQSESLTFPFMVWHFQRRLHAATSALSSSSFYQGISPKSLGFLMIFRKTIYLHTILAISGTIWSLKLKTKIKVSKTNIKKSSKNQFLLVLQEGKFMSNHHKINSLARYLKYLFQYFFHL